jgi:hypothetical protein
MNAISIQKADSGNAMIYVLIVVALFAALSFALSRNSSDEASSLGPERVNVYASQIIAAANGMKQGVDQVVYSGTRIDSLNFCLPGEVCFTSAPLSNNVFHPDGGGMVRANLPAETINEVDNNPDPGWYIGRFNNVEWTDSAAQDVIVTAHQIREDICAQINKLLTGSDTIPALAVDINKALIDDAYHTNTPNADLTVANCAGCEGKAALCVVNAAGTIWSYYSVIEQQ